MIIRKYCRSTVALLAFIFLSCNFPVDDYLVKFQNPELKLEAESLTLVDDSMVIKFNGEVYSFPLESHYLFFYDYTNSLYAKQGIVLKVPSNEEINISYEKRFYAESFDVRYYFKYIDNLVLIDNLNQIYILPYTFSTSFGYIDNKINNKLKAIIKADLYKKNEIDIGPIEGAIAYPIEIQISATYNRNNNSDFNKN